MRQTNRRNKSNRVKRTAMILTLGLSLALPGLALARPADGTLKARYNGRYNAERYAKADRNQDGKLDKREANREATSREKRMWVGGDRFSDADHNGNGRLSKQEAWAQRKAERNAYRMDSKPIHQMVKKERQRSKHKRCFCRHR